MGETVARLEQIETHSDRFARKIGAHPGQWIKVPTWASPLQKRPVSLQDVDDLVVAGWIMSTDRSPTLEDLRRMSGRSRSRLKGAIGRLVEAGYLKAGKAAYKYGEGRREWAARWVYSIPSSSPLTALLPEAESLSAEERARRKMPPQPRAWIAVPARIARYRSSIAVAAYLVLHDLKLRDGSVTITPRRLASLLHCHRSTAERLLRFMGARKVATIGRESVYDLELVFFPKQAGEPVKIAQADVLVFGNRERMLDRHAALRRALRGVGVDVDRAEQTVVDHLADRDLRLHIVTRVLEETYRLELGVSEYAGTLRARMASRVRGLTAFRETGPERGQTAAVAKRFLAASTSSIDDAALSCCDGVGYVETPDGWQRCPRCRT